MVRAAIQDETHRLHAMYREGDPPADAFRALAFEVLDEEEALADLIELDGRLRMGRQLPISLDRYLAAVENLPHHADALDAAIDVVLRARYEHEESQEKAVQSLIADYPNLEPQIRESAALSNAIWSTSGLRTRLALPPTRPLPEDFGPAMPDGKRRYSLTRPLGEGAFGQVYLAVDRQLSEEDHDALVAIKILTPTTRGPWTRQTLIDEAAKARRVDHGNVVRVLDRNTSDAGEDYIVYEYVDGGDLARWIRRQTRPIGLRTAVSIMAQVARGVEAAHAAGLVHCDLKPGNIMITNEQIPKVADFGVSVRFGDRRQAGTRPGQESNHPIGNIAFIAPEQFRMEPGALSVPADVYALGGMLFLLLTGELPNGSTIEAISKRHARESDQMESPSPAAHRQEISRDLDAICARALAPDPAARHRSAGELADDLERWLSHRPVPWMHPSPVRVGFLWVRRRPVVAALCVLVLIGVVATAVGFAKARAEAQRAEDEAQWKKEVTERVTALFSRGLPNLRQLANHAQSEMLASMWLLDMTFGPRLIDNPEKAIQIRQEQIQYFRDQVEAARSHQRHGDLMTLLWEFALVFLLLVDHQTDEAHAVLVSNERGWRALLDPDDPWLEELALLRHIADAQLLVSSSDSDQEGLHRLNEVVGLMESRNKQFQDNERRSPLHRLTLRTLAESYGATGLDDPQRATELRDELTRLEAE